MKLFTSTNRVVIPMVLIIFGFLESGLAVAQNKEAIIVADLDPRTLKQSRQALPSVK